MDCDKKNIAGKEKTEKSRALELIFFFLVITFLVFGYTRASWGACGAPECACEPAQMPTTKDLVTSEHVETREHITAEFDMHEDFLLDTFFTEYLLPSMMQMTEQLSAIAIHQVFAISTMIDAKTQLETQLLTQKLETRAFKDYTPSVDVCIIGTNVRSLAASEQSIAPNAFVLSQRSQDRQIGNINSSAAEGEPLDRDTRLKQFVERYCQPEDNAGGLDLLCTTPPASDHRNKDINYSQVIDTPLTINIDFCDYNSGPGRCMPKFDSDEEAEKDVWALANNLYAHDLFLRVPDEAFYSEPNQNAILDIRSVIAKRSVAENSFNMITAMKTKGSEDSADTAAYIANLLQELNLPLTEIEGILGENPSYYAQMEVLTKKLYQRPEFYTNLYDTPANVERQSVALKAIDLMQDLDTLKSSLRTEMMLSILLEMAVTDLQTDVENRLAEQRP